MHRPYLQSLKKKKKIYVIYDMSSGTDFDLPYYVFVDVFFLFYILYFATNRKLYIKKRISVLLPNVFFNAILFISGTHIFFTDNEFLMIMNFKNIQRKKSARISFRIYIVNNVILKT